VTSVDSNRIFIAPNRADDPALAELAALLDATSDAVYFGTAEGITMANQAGLDQLGLRSIDELAVPLGQLQRRVDVRDAITGQQFGAGVGVFARALAGQRSTREILIRRQDTGEERVVVATASPVIRDGVVVGAVTVNRDITDQRRAEARAAESAERLRIAMSTGSLGSWEVDLATGGMEASAICKANVGADPTLPLSYEGVMALIHPDDIERVRASVRRAIEQHVDYAEEFRVGSGDQTRWVAASGRVLYDATGAPARMVGVTQDITVRRTSEDLIRQARDAAESASRAKSEFLAVMSHELRTPLNAIGGYAELLDLGLRGPVTDAQRVDLARIQKSQRHLLGLINEVLTSARLESGTVGYQLDDVDVEDAVSTCEALIAPQAKEKAITFEYHGCLTGATVYADADKLRQILINLLGNAVKFTDDGGRIDVRCDASRDDRLAIDVTDTGHGISAEHLQNVFEPFVQIDAGPRRNHEGIGLGLAISRELARGMNGDVTVTSEVGRGSTFTLTLPRRGLATAQ